MLPKDLNKASITSHNIGSNVVYPSHGVGEIVGIEKKVLYGTETHYYRIAFPQDNMVISLPVDKAEARGLRSLTPPSAVHKIYEILSSKPMRNSRTWSRKLQEYMEEKLRSGDVFLITEVIRDLHKKSHQDRSYSERVLYEFAIKKLAGELAIIESVEIDYAISKITQLLNKAASSTSAAPEDEF